jgi:hypothetical protein
VLQERPKGLAEVAGPDASRINAAHAAKSQRAREEKVPELMIAALQKLVREIRSSRSAFQAGVNSGSALPHAESGPAIWEFASFQCQIRTNPNYRSGYPKNWRRRRRKSSPDNSERRNSALSDDIEREDRAFYSHSPF